MPSKHLKHFDLISCRLKDGQSLVSICKELSRVGLTTTPQGLSQWLARRSKKIAAAKTLLDPGPAVLVAEVSKAVAIKKSKASEKAASVSPVSSAVIPLPVIGRSSSIAKPEPSDLEKQLAKLAVQAAQTPANNWKTK